MAAQSVLLRNRNLQDMNPLILGEEACEAGHSFGPAVRRYTLIHYVSRGRGVLHTQNGSYSVGPGQAFVILPGEVNTYTADMEDPWHYSWIGFDGALSHRFAELGPVITLPESVLQRMLRCAREDPSMAEYRLSAELLRLYAMLFSKTAGTHPHVRRVENYIRSAYMEPIRVEQIAQQLNLDRRYLSRLFKEKTGQTIQEYLIQVRMEEAEYHLRQGRTVKEAAHLSGYEDVANFSKMFKRKTGRSPADLRTAT